MKSLFFITLSILVLSCQQAEKPSQTVASAVPIVDSMPPIGSSNIYKDSTICNDPPPLGYEGNQDTIPKVLKKFEQNGTLCEHKSYTKGYDKRPEWLKITKPNKSCRIIDMTSYSHTGSFIEDWDGDGFLDLVELMGRSGRLTVSLFDTKTNDFTQMGHIFSNDIWDFDKAKGLKIEHFGKFDYAYYRQGFNNVYNLYTIKQGELIIVSSITFSIDGEGGKPNCVLEIKNDESKTPVKDAAFFEALRKKAETISPTQDGDADYEAWIKEAKPLVENYWRQKF